MSTNSKKSGGITLPSATQPLLGGGGSGSGRALRDLFFKKGTAATPAHGMMTKEAQAGQPPSLPPMQQPPQAAPASPSAAPPSAAGASSASEGQQTESTAAAATTSAGAGGEHGSGSADTAASTSDAPSSSSSSSVAGSSSKRGGVGASGGASSSSSSSRPTIPRMSQRRDRRIGMLSSLMGGKQTPVDTSKQQPQSHPQHTPAKRSSKTLSAAGATTDGAAMAAGAKKSGRASKKARQGDVAGTAAAHGQTDAFMNDEGKMTMAPEWPPRQQQQQAQQQQQQLQPMQMHARPMKAETIYGSSSEPLAPMGYESFAGTSEQQQHQQQSSDLIDLAQEEEASSEDLKGFIELPNIAVQPLVTGVQFPRVQQLLETRLIPMMLQHAQYLSNSGATWEGERQELAEREEAMCHRVEEVRQRLATFPFLSRPRPPLAQQGASRGGYAPITQGRPLALPPQTGYGGVGGAQRGQTSAPAMRFAGGSGGGGGGGGGGGTGQQRQPAITGSGSAAWRGGMGPTSNTATHPFAAGGGAGMHRTSTHSGKK